MRLHLDPANANGAAETNGAKSAAPLPGTAAASPSAVGAADSGLSDKVAVSGASSAWTTSFSERAARIGQLTAAVQNGIYSVPRAALSQSIVASAIV